MTALAPWCIQVHLPPPRLIKLSFAELRRISWARWEEAPAPGQSTCYSAWLINLRRGGGEGPAGPSLLACRWRSPLVRNAVVSAAFGALYTAHTHYTYRESTELILPVPIWLIRLPKLDHYTSKNPCINVCHHCQVCFSSTDEKHIGSTGDSTPSHLFSGIPHWQFFFFFFLIV